MYLDVSDEDLNTRGGNVLVAVTAVLHGASEELSLWTGISEE